MTKLSPFTFNDLKDLEKFFVGFDDQFNRLARMHDDLTKNVPNYPPYNIRKVEDNKYIIELAIAGFSKQEVEIELQDDKLVVKGNATEDKETDWIYKGIAARNFTRTFALNDQVEVRGAEMLNGMLKIFLERIIPEHKKPKKIDISDEPNTVSEFAANNKSLLLEEIEDRM